MLRRGSRYGWEGAYFSYWQGMEERQADGACPGRENSIIMEGILKPCFAFLLFWRFGVLFCFFVCFVLVLVFLFVCFLFFVLSGLSLPRGQSHIKIAATSDIIMESVVNGKFYVPT